MVSKKILYTHNEQIKGFAVAIIAIILCCICFIVIFMGIIIHV